MIEDWCASLVAKDSAAVGAMDLSKAFDGVNHNLCFPTTATNSNCKYLMEQCQSVKIEGVCSEWKCVVASVPQGSLLGSLLFNIYINNVNYSVPNMTLRLYADDTTEYNSDASSLALQYMVYKNLSTLSPWFEQNLPSINNTKTEV